MITYRTLEFPELSLGQLYRILQLRSEVFVVEQTCVYQDIDNKDSDAIHVIGLNEINEIHAYARILKPGVSYNEFSIGRVIVSSSHRRKKEGHRLMEVCMKYIETHAGKRSVRISAQAHLASFYITHQFTSTGKEYLEDGIPHIEMIYIPKFTK